MLCPSGRNGIAPPGQASEVTAVVIRARHARPNGAAMRSSYASRGAMASKHPPPASEDPPSSRDACERRLAALEEKSLVVDIALRALFLSSPKLMRILTLIELDMEAWAARGTAASMSAPARNARRRMRQLLADLREAADPR